MKKWNRMLAAVLSASMIISMAPAGVWAAETAAVQESQEESGEFDAAMAAAQDSEEALAGGSDAASSEVAEEAESGAAEAVDEATAADEADAADQTEAVDEAAGAEAEDADAVEDDGAEADEDTDAETAEEKDAVSAEEADAAISEQNGAEAEPESEESSEAEYSSEEEAAESGETEAVSKEAAAAGESGQETEKPVDGNELSYMTLDSESLTSHMDMRDNDELFEEYANRMFYGARSSGMKLRSSNMAGRMLEGQTRVIYDVTKPEIKKIADGERNSAIIQVSLRELGFNEQYSADELGLEYIKNDDGMNPELQQKVGALFTFDPNQLHAAVLADCPYELYWNDGSMKPALCSFGYDSQYVYFDLDKCISMKFGVDPDYSLSGGDEYSVDTTKTSAVKSASDRAQQIVNEAAKMSDYYKLNYYREQICDLVEYNHDAAGNDDYPNHGPWNLIFVFDDNPATNVVCEGYAEAFQYLAELTAFKDVQVKVYSVTGTMSGGTGAGEHKWNIVHMDDGNNYLTDITNSDAGSIGSDGSLFLAGMEGSAQSKYSKDYTSKTIEYTYDSYMYSIYSTEELTLSSDDYQFGNPSTADDKAILKGLSLFLTDKIGMRVYVKTFVDRLSNDDYMVFSYADENETVYVSEAKNVKILDSDGKSIDVLVFEIELCTDQMTEEVSFHLNIDGQNGMEKTYSVRSYADQILAGNYSEKQKNMVRAMLNYGGYAQTYFKYNTDNMANDGIFGENDPVQQELAIGDYGYDFKQAEDTKGFHIKQAALYLGTDVSLIYYYTLEDGVETTDFSFSLDDPSRELIFDRNEENGKDYVMIPHILPGELDKMFTLTVTPVGKSEPVTTLSYSPFCYCKTILGDANRSDAIKNLCKSLYYYWKAATEMSSYSNNVVLSINEQDYLLILEDNAEARSFSERLPLTLNMTFGDSTGSATLSSSIPNSGPVTDNYPAAKGDLVLINENRLGLVLVDNLYYSSNRAYVTIGKIQSSANFESLQNLGSVEISFAAQ